MEIRIKEFFKKSMSITPFKVFIQAWVSPFYRKRRRNAIVFIKIATPPGDGVAARVTV